jgi:hypothetical protein
MAGRCIELSLTIIGLRGLADSLEGWRRAFSYLATLLASLSPVIAFALEKCIASFAQYRKAVALILGWVPEGTREVLTTAPRAHYLSFSCSPAWLTRCRFSSSSCFRQSLATASNTPPPE